MPKYQQITQILTSAIPQLIAIYMFGSEAQATANQFSDIDLAVLTPSKLSSQTRWELTNQLARMLKRDIDLVDLRATSTVLQWQIINTGIKIYTSDNYKSDLFEAHVLSDYIRLNELRGELLQDIQQRGRIYGE